MKFGAGTILTVASTVIGVAGVIVGSFNDKQQRAEIKKEILEELKKETKN